jgi:hypothetical protein
MGIIFSCILVFLALVILAYVCQCLFLSIGEAVHFFNQLDPLVRLALFALAAVFVALRARDRAAAKVKESHNGQ